MLKRVVFVVGALSALGACVATRSLIDTASDHVVASIDVGANPHGLAISGDGSRVLVSGWGSNEAEVIDTSTGRVIGSVPVAQPHNGTLSRDVRVGWVASQKQDATALVRLDLAMWKEVARVPLNETPRRVEPRRSPHLLYTGWRQCDSGPGHDHQPDRWGFATLPAIYS